MKIGGGSEGTAEEPSPNRWCAYLVVSFFIILIATHSSFCQEDDAFDLLIRNGTVYDGVWHEPRNVDIAIQSDRIVAVRSMPDVSAKRILDASGLVVAPGFIDIHTHSDFNAMLNADSLHKIFQGVTTEVVGNCGMSAAPVYGPHEKEIRNVWLREGVVLPSKIGWQSVRQYFAVLLEQSLVTNMALLAGHGNLRSSVMGFEAREATDEEITRMRDLLRQSMEEGALGLSLGLSYLPGVFADEKEILSLAEETKAQGGILAVHMRSEGRKLVESVDEVIEMARKTGIRVEISHLKAAGLRNWRKIDEVFSKIESAQREGVAIFADAYPYEASFAELGVILPEAIYRRPDRLKLLSDPSERTRLKKKVAGEFEKSGISLMNVRIAKTNLPQHAPYEGHTVQELAERAGKDPLDFLFDLLVEENFEVSSFSFSQSSEIVKRVMRKSYVSVGSDSIADFGPKPHPRTYGTFPRVIGKFVREDEILLLGEAIRKMSFLPARVLGLGGRGKLAAGYFADIVIFDLDAIRSRASYEHPNRLAAGMRHVLINGRMVIRDGRPTGVKAGQVLRKETKGSAVTRA